MSLLTTCKIKLNSIWLAKFLFIQLLLNDKQSGELMDPQIQIQFNYALEINIFLECKTKIMMNHSYSIFKSDILSKKLNSPS